MQVKICGLTNLDDARAALDSGADYLGFVLYDKSPRCISRTNLRRIQERLPDITQSIAVFVNESRAEILKIASECGLYAVQLHGQESPNRFTGMSLPLWRAVSFLKGRPVPQPDEWKAERFIIDSSVKGKYGGTGVVAEWTKAADFSRNWPSILAGGLDVNNIREAIRMVRPRGVDVASGIEQNQRKKDRRKMDLFIRLAKGQ